jgi:hypothetical protein
LNRHPFITRRKDQVESPSAKTFRSHHPPTEARWEASRARFPRDQPLSQSGFGGWVEEKIEVRRAAVPLLVTQRGKRCVRPKISSTTFDNSSIGPHETTTAAAHNGVFPWEICDAVAGSQYKVIIAGTTEGTTAILKFDFPRNLACFQVRSPWQKSRTIWASTPCRYSCDVDLVARSCGTTMPLYRAVIVSQLYHTQNKSRRTLPQPAT